MPAWNRWRIAATTAVFLCVWGADGLARAEAAAAASGLEAEIRAVDAEFVRRYEAGDAMGLAALYAEDAEVFEADGARYVGRELVQKSYEATFAENKGARQALEIETIRSLSPDVAKEEGRSVITLPSGRSIARFYTALFVKRDGAWLIAGVREEDDRRVGPAERLKELEWLLGEWVDSGPESETRVDCRWSADGNFLLRDFTVLRAGKTVMDVSQRIGWDAVVGEFHSWEFDSEGGFGEGRWSRDGDRWVVKETGSRPEGVTASSTRILQSVRRDQVRWSRVDLVIGGVAVPGLEESILTRRPPAPRATTPNDEARPR